MCLSPLRICEHSENILAHKKSNKKITNIIAPQKVTVGCDEHSNGRGSPYYFYNETVRAVGYYQMLNTNIQSEAEQFQQNAGFCLIVLLLTLHFPIVLFWIICFQFHVLQDIIQQFGGQDHAT